MSLIPGARVGPYEIVGALGGGGMGEVYSARDPRLGREVAIKILPAEFSSDPDRLRRFEQEARAAAALNHPNILAVYDIGTAHGAPYIVSELLEGETLRDRMAASDGLAIRKAIDAAVQIARGLAAAHEKGIVHRDLKPENVFLTRDGQVKILDFGLAKLTEPTTGGNDAATRATGTAPGIVMGTVGYMAPEQARGRQADHRSDIFALGAILYEMLSGQRAFHGPSPADTISAILDKDPPDLPTASRRISPALARTVDRCLAKDPAARFQSSSDLAFALEALFEPPAAAVAIDQVSTTKSSRGLLAWSIASLAIIVSAVLAVWTSLRGAATETPSLRATILPPQEWAITGTSPPNRLALSPDGSALAFVATGTDTEIRTCSDCGRYARRLWVRRLDSMSAQPVEGTDGATQPFWSPDGRRIGFFADQKLKVVDASSGRVSQVCETPGVINPTAVGATWAKDDTILFGMPGAGIVKVPATGGTPMAVTAANEGRNHNLPFMLPDGRHFIFRSGRSNDVSQSEIFVGSIDSDQPQSLHLTNISQAMYAQGFLFYARDASLMAQRFDAERLLITGEPVSIADNVATGGGGNSAFTVAQNGAIAFQTGGLARGRLVWVDRTGKQLSVIGKEAAYGDVHLAPDGTRALVSIRSDDNGGRDIWVVDLFRGVPTRLTFGDSDESSAIWSPNASRVVFNSMRQGRLDLYETDTANAGSDQLLVTDDTAKDPFSWSANGRFILYRRGSAASLSGIWVLPMFGDRKPIPFADRPEYNEDAGSFSPDGRWVAFRSNESGRSEIYAAPFPGPGEKTTVSADGALWLPRWRGDGKELFYLNAANRLMSALVDGSGPKFYVKEVRPLFEVRAAFSGAGIRSVFDVTANGQQFLINESVEEVSSPVTLILNWKAQLRR